MARRFALHTLILLAVLALVLPVAAGAGSCLDCPGSGSADCCPPACCSCCMHGGVTLSLALLDSELGEAGRAGEPAEVRALPAASRDVFHVPKSSLG